MYTAKGSNKMQYNTENFKGMFMANFKVEYNNYRID